MGEILLGESDYPVDTAKAIELFRIGARNDNPVARRHLRELGENRGDVKYAAVFG